MMYGFVRVATHFVFKNSPDFLQFSRSFYQPLGAIFQLFEAISPSIKAL